MPELPEVETMVRGIRPEIEGLQLCTVSRCRCTRKPILITPKMRQITKRTVGTTVTSIFRFAKRVVMQLSSEDSFVIEPRMTGLMLLSDPPSKQHLRLEWTFKKKGSKKQAKSTQTTSLWFWDRRGLGTIRLLSPEEFEEQLGSHKLGPDALKITTSEWSQRCAKTSRAIKVVMLDQKIVAGIGNLYASEILHLAKINPTTSANLLTREEIKKMNAATKKILQEAIRYEGSTLGDGTYRNALNQSGSYQNSHQVYAREDKQCQTCLQEKIVRMVQSQRSTFYCPRCQPGEST